MSVKTVRLKRGWCSYLANGPLRVDSNERNTMRSMKRGFAGLATTLLLSGGLGLAGLELAAGAAHADDFYGPGYTWCPGDPEYTLPVKDGLGWDMSVCHTYHTVPFGQRNVPIFDTQGNPMDSWIWADSPPPVPPPGPPRPHVPYPSHCAFPGFPFFNPSECGGL